MALGKQAKVLTKQQIDAVLAHLTNTRHPARNKLIFLLSVRAGLRAKEIAGLTWSMVSNADGALADEIQLQDHASKGRSGRKIPISKELKLSLLAWHKECEATQPSARVVQTERSSKTLTQVIINMFGRWYANLGFVGCSSHSGRRTFITNAARRIGTVGGSLRDVQSLAGHASLNTTERYIDVNADAKRKVVELIT